MYWKKIHFFFHFFSHYLDLLFDSLLKHVIVWFTVSFIFKNTETVFLGKVFRHVLQLYATLDQFSAVELVLVKILAVQKSKSSHWRIFFKVSESLLMVLAKTFVPCSLLGIIQEKYSTKYFFRCFMPRLHSRKQVEAHVTALEVLITDKQGHICHKKCDHLLPDLQDC